MGLDAEVSFTCATEDLRIAEATLAPVIARVRPRQARDRSRGRQGLDHRRGHALASRRRRKGLPGARRREDQHRDDPHLADQDHLPDPRRLGAAGGPRPARRVSTSGPATSRPRAASGRRRDELGYRIAVVGATGAVGTVMLQCLKERGLDQGNEIVLFATLAFRRPRDRRAHRARARGGRRPQRHRHRAVLGRRRHLEGVGAALRRGRRDSDRQLLGVPARPGRAAGRLRGEPARAAQTTAA